MVSEVTDGDSQRYRGPSFFYDLVKTSVMRLAFSLAHELRARSESGRLTSLAIMPGFLRTEAMLDRFGVTEPTWLDAIRQDPNFAASETTRFVGRAVAAVAADAIVSRHAGQTLSSWSLAKLYAFTDVDGRRPDCGAYYAALAGRMERPKSRSIRRAQPQGSSGVGLGLESIRAKLRYSGVLESEEAPRGQSPARRDNRPARVL